MPPTARSTRVLRCGVLGRIIWRVGLLALLAVGFNAPHARAQMTDELADIFQQIIQHVEPDLKAKFQQALEQDSDLIVFTPDQFRRFRDHPINPFDSLLEIDPDELDSAIELKFEIPSLRARRPHPAERQHDTVLTQLRHSVQQASQSTVAIVRNGKTIALGVVVDDRGSVLTKASEVAKTGETSDHTAPLHVTQGQRSLVPARIRRVDTENDLALLETDLRDTIPIAWNERALAPGEFVVTNDAQGRAIALGTYSHAPRSVLGTEQAYLGIQPQNAQGGVRVVEITPNSAADRAGLRVGDVVHRLNGKLIRDVAELVSEVRQQRPGSRIQLEVSRDGRTIHPQVELSRRKLPADRAARFLMMNRLGAIPSQRATDFRRVLQHDAPLFPEQCGGPLLDLEGQAIGLNIARQGRVSTLAIPADHVKVILRDLLRDDVASQK